MFKNLQELGLGKKFIETIKSLYIGDNITTRINGKQSRTIYLKQGVRQGCSLSPILFALYLKDMGDTLHRSKQGTTIGKGMKENPQGVTISAMFFADDLILIAE